MPIDHKLAGVTPAKPMDHKRLQALLRKLGISQSELACRLDVDVRTVRRWILIDLVHRC